MRRLAINTRRLRGGAALSQERLAELVGCATTYVQRVEAGAANPTMSFIAALAYGLGADPSELLLPPQDPGESAD